MLFSVQLDCYVPSIIYVHTSTVYAYRYHSQILVDFFLIHILLTSLILTLYSGKRAAGADRGSTRTRARPPERAIYRLQCAAGQFHRPERPLRHPAVRPTAPAHPS